MIKPPTRLSFVYKETEKLVAIIVKSIATTEKTEKLIFTGN
jgi:hypothetical protein